MTLNLPPTPPDWSDHHSGPVAPPLAPARAVFRRALTHGPRWLGAAMALRNLVVRPFGLVTRVDDTTGPTDGTKDEPGGCDCDSGRPFDPSLLLIGLVAALRRRRR